jgi:hypothetical protein
MRQNIRRGAALVIPLALFAAACSSPHKTAKSPTTVFPTIADPGTEPPATTAPASTVTKKGTPTSAPGAGATTTSGVPVTLATAPVTTTTIAAPPPTFPGGIVMRWKLALDFRTHPGRNPFSSYRGGPPVWSLHEGSTLSRNGNYPLLPTFSSTFGVAGISAWHDNSQGCPSGPAIGVNIAPGSVSLCKASIPAGAAFLVPDSSHTAVVAWTSPFTGVINISNDAIADLDGSCGDGVSYFVDLGTTQLVAVRLTNNNAAQLPPTLQRVAAGQTLYFIVDPGPGDDASCDATQLAITVDRLAT